MSNIVQISWLIFLLVWLVTAFMTKKRKEVVASNQVYFMTKVLFVLALVALDKIFFTNKFLFQNFATVPNIISIVATILVLIGLVLAIDARLVLGRNWSGTISFQKDHQLITSGPYRYMRHPIYTAMFLMIIGTMIVIPTIFTLLGGITILFYLRFKAGKEEELMLRHFPVEYSNYKKQTKAYIPFFW